MIHLCGPKSSRKDVIDTTSRSQTWSRGLSPFFLGPVNLYGGHVSQNVENAWQHTKVYPEHVGKDGEPTPDYFAWAREGWADNFAHRYPMGKGRKPAYSYWDGAKLTYVEARKKVYAPLYAQAVEPTEAFQRLKEAYETLGALYLWDFDAYNHRRAGMTYRDVLNCPDRKMGHAFVLAMMLEGQRAWEE